MSFTFKKVKEFLSDNCGCKHKLSWRVFCRKDNQTPDLNTIFIKYLHSILVLGVDNKWFGITSSAVLECNKIITWSKIAHIILPLGCLICCPYAHHLTSYMTDNYFFYGFIKIDNNVFISGLRVNCPVFCFR